MARIRTIKPDFWTDDKLTECSLSARLLFIGTWNFADDAGNLDRSPKQIKARVFPLDNIDCEPLLRELIAQGLLTEYSVDSKNYLHIQGFTKHQVINRRSAPTCPAYDESLSANGLLPDDSLSTHAGREGKGREDIGSAPAKAVGFCFKTALTDAGGMPDLVADWLKVRAKLKAANTKTAFNLFMREVERAGYTVNQALEVCCSRSWKGFDADWVKGSKPAEQETPKLDTSLESRRAGLQAQADESYQTRQWLDGERKYRTIITIENGQIVRTKHYDDRGIAA